MDWLNDLLLQESVAHTILVYSVVIAAGVALGKIRIFGVSLGITFVLFAGIAAAHFGFRVNMEQLDFIKDFGLILFVFSIGLQVGPGFFSSFKKGGLSLNLMALSIVILGGLTTLIIHYITGMSLATMVGVMSGAVTNTPGLGAAQQVLKQVSATYPDANMPYIGLGYAVAYPFGVVGIILTMLFLRKVNRVNLQKELDDFNEHQHPVESLPEKVSIRVENPVVFNKSIHQICALLHSKMVISRLLHQGELLTPNHETIIHENDIILLVAEKGVIPDIVKFIGSQSDMDLSAKTGKLQSKHIIVTNKEVFGKKLGDLKLRSKYNINITRVYRSGMEFVASPNLQLLMGDRLTIVGDDVSIDKAAIKLGNSLKRLNEPNIIPIFIGILLGVLLGSVPILIPGIPNPLKLGLAGGPLIIAILLSKYGYKFSMTSYTTPGANLMLREIGIVLFLASVGIKSGEKFIPTLLSGDGFIWMGYGAIITLVPILIVGFFSRLMLKKNYFEICGLLAGSMTDPPALAYANAIAQSEAPTIAYATVYPLVMFSRILVAQLLILLFM
jgi:putative transport protein